MTKSNLERKEIILFTVAHHSQSDNEVSIGTQGIEEERADYGKVRGRKREQTPQYRNTREEMERGREGKTEVRTIGQ